MESRERVVCMVLGSRGEGKVTVWRAESIELKRDVEELRRVEVILGSPLKAFSSHLRLSRLAGWQIVCV